MIEDIWFNGVPYPKLQAEGNMSQYCIPFAQKFCKGVGLDIGYSKEEWKFPGAIGVDLDHTPPYHADNLPPSSKQRISEGRSSLWVSDWDYIFSSHCLEHVPNWVNTLKYWTSTLHIGGVLFLYLPHPDQEYWLPWNNTKHNHILHPQDVVNCLKNCSMQKIYCSERDLAHSYIVVCERR